jgi:hypothetical protein
MTRTLAFLLVANGLLAAMAILPTATGQALPPVTVLSDDEGDAVTTVAGTPGPSADAIYPSADLVSLSLVESASDLTWVLQVGDLRPASEETGADGMSYEVRLEHHRRYFILRIVRSLPMLQDNAYAYLEARDASDGQWGTVWTSYDGLDSGVAMDFAAETYTVTVPRTMLADAEGAPPFPGRNLTAITVRSVTTAGGGLIYTDGSGSPLLAPYTITDNMPDAGEPAGAYAMLVGVQQSGHAHLASPAPFRASNGEATTFVYQVEATNLGDENETFELTVRDVATRLDVVIPVPLLPIPANSTMVVPILANVPFAHDHGALDTFLLELTSLDDPDAVGRLEMGVNYLAVPQPAGHHDTLFLHNPPGASATPGLQNGLLPFRTGTMSTAEDETAMPPFHSESLTFTGVGSRFEWRYALAPALQMGLDVDLERSGHVSITIGSTAPVLQATLEGQLYVLGRNEVLVAAFAPHTPVDIGTQADHTFELDLIPNEDADRVPWEPGSNLVLYLSMEGTTAPTGLGSETSPYVRGGAFMSLPLNEWHDDVDDALAAVDGPGLESLGPQERLVNPGEAVVFNVSVENPTNESVSFRLAVTGKNVEWATLSQTSLVLPAESTGNLSLVVRAPADALDDDRADLILQAYPRDEPALRGLIRLVVDVDTDADHVDEAPLAKKLSKKDSPGPALPLLGAALVAAALSRKRRRD